MKIIKLLQELIESELKLCIEELKEYERLHNQDAFNLEAGRVIEEISNLYPASYQDAAIIFEEWCKGLLLECRPERDVLREYARYTAQPENFRRWLRERKTQHYNYVTKNTIKRWFYVK